MAPKWYVLRSKPRREAAVWQQVLAQGLEAYYPSLEVQPANPRARKIRPYFPGYLFVRADLDQVGLSTFQWMPYAQGLVSFGGVAASVPDEVVAGIRGHLQQIELTGSASPFRLNPGDRVIIQDGIFKGYEAILDARLHGKDRVRVLLQLLHRCCLRVQLRLEQIRPKKSAPTLPP